MLYFEITQSANFAPLSNSITRQSILLESCKPSKDSASLLVCNEENFVVLGFGFFVGGVISEVGFGHFGSGYLAPIARWKYFARLKFEYYEPLISFLVQELE